jgi:hypothetical protein
LIRKSLVCFVPMMNIEICPLCNNSMQGNWREIGAWQPNAPIHRVFEGWQCPSGCDRGPRAAEWQKLMRSRQGSPKPF